MTDYVIRGAVDDDAEALAPIMRDLDRQEVWAQSRSTPLQALRKGLGTSVDSFTALADGVPFCMFGVSPFTKLGGWAGSPWLLTSKDIVTHRVMLMRYSAPVLHYWSREMFPYLVNMVDVRHRPGLAWAKRIGFTISSTVLFGPDQMPFHKIELRRGDV